MTSEPSDSIESTIQPLVHALSGHDPLPPWSARRALEAIGPDAVPSLTEAMRAGSTEARWEAAKALSAIADPASAGALVAALDDDDGGVRWLAAQALAHIGPAALPPVLLALIRNPTSAWLREGAHHVLRVLATDDFATLLEPVLKAMHGLEPAIGVMSAADRALAGVESRLAMHAAIGVPGLRYAPRGPALHTHGSWRHIALRP